MTPLFRKVEKSDKEQLPLLPMVVLLASSYDGSLCFRKGSEQSIASKTGQHQVAF